MRDRERSIVLGKVEIEGRERIVRRKEKGREAERF